MTLTREWIFDSNDQTPPALDQANRETADFFFTRASWCLSLFKFDFNFIVPSEPKLGRLIVSNSLQIELVYLFSSVLDQFDSYIISPSRPFVFILSVPGPSRVSLHGPSMNRSFDDEGESKNDLSLSSEEPKNVTKPTSSASQDHLMQLFTPMLIQLESSVAEVAASQGRLNDELNTLMSRLKQVKEASSNDRMAIILEEKSKRLIALKRRLTLVHTLIQNSNERCRRLIVQNRIPAALVDSK